MPASIGLNLPEMSSQAGNKAILEVRTDLLVDGIEQCLWRTAVAEADLRGDVFEQHSVERGLHAVATDIAHKKEQRIVRIARKVDNIATDRNHGLPQVSERHPSDFGDAARDHHVLDLFGTGEVGQHGFVGHA